MIENYCTKVICFGIGADVDKEFIKKMGRASGGGKSEFIGTGKGLEKTAIT